MSKKLISFKKFYFKLLLDFKYYFFIMQVCMLSWSLQESLSPYFIKRIVDILDSNKLNKQTILSDNSSFFITSALTYLAIEIGYRLYEFIGSKFYPILRMHVRIHILEHIIGHSHEFFTHNFSGSISNIISRFTESIQDISEKIICIFVPVSISLIITTILLFNASLYLGIGLIIWFVIYFFVLINFANKSQKLAEIHSQQVSGLNGLINDIISNIFTVRIFSKSKFEISKLKNDNQTEISASLNSSLYNFKINTILAFVTSIFIVYMIFGGISLWQKNLITTSELVLSISSLYIVGLVWYMGFNLIPFYTQIGICKEGVELINTNHEIIDSVKTKLQIQSGKIEFKNVSFDYKNNNNILENCNIIINANQKIGLVGLSGSGKTTFANLIIRLFDTSEGSILIDNIDIQHISQDNLRSEISYIPQDTTLFHRTILENIKYGNNDATLNEVIAAAKLSKAHDFIIHLKDGYQTIVGEKGSKLSGGQRQRIAITRAILKNSKIIIMDEATSALDLLTEHEIQQNIYKNITEKTLIVIAHRLNTLKEMDRILVFRKGSIIEDGTHNELIGKKGYYFELWNKGNNSN